MIQDKRPTLSYKTSRKVAIPVAELRLGMYVAELDRPWEEPRHGLPLVWQLDSILVSACKYCVAEILRGPVGQHDGVLIG